MRRWEYMMLDRMSLVDRRKAFAGGSQNPFEPLMTRLNELGAEGWELVPLAHEQKYLLLRRELD